MQLVVTPAARSAACTPRRSTWRRSAASRSPAPATSSPTPDGRWTADMTPVGGPVLGPFDRRSEALEAEHAWLEAHWLVPRA